MKFIVNKSFYKNINSQFDDFEKRGIINTEQKNIMLSAYEINKGTSPISLASTIGAILVGIGILVFIAGNWSAISPLFRMTILLFGLLSTYIIGIKLEVSHPKTAFSLRLLSVFIFGGSLFLTDQTFNLNRSIPELFLLFALGVFIINLAENSSTILYSIYDILLCIVFISLFMSSYKLSDIKAWTLGLLAFIAILIGIHSFRKVSFNTIGYNLNILSISIALITISAKLEFSFIPVLLMTFIWGILSISVFPKLLHENPTIEFSSKRPTMGFFIMGISGLMMTIAEIWEESFSIYGNSGFNAHIISIIFAILFFIYLMYLYKKGYAESIVFIVGIILRFYFDMFYSFMPKSLFFIIGGILLMGIGWFMESRRRAQLNTTTVGGMDDETK